MPTYTYRCNECKDETEKVQKMTDSPLTVCEKCKGELSKIITGFGGFQLKGKGWFNKGGY